MNNPFFRSRWSQPSSAAGATPVEYIPKVVSIPVHFLGSDPVRSASAVKIQKVFRGFMVRKSVKKIASVRREVEAIERKISRREIVDLISRDGRERLRVSESLMALLLKLDSVRGVDLGVRELRKAAIKKAIALQERVDAIAAGDRALEIEEMDESQTPEIEERSLTLEIDKNTNLVSKNCENRDVDVAEASVDPGVKAVEEGCVVKQIVEESVGTDWNTKGEVKDCVESGERGDYKCDTELLERLLDDNEKMMSLMTQLFHRNEVQTRMLTSLTQRVEHLESAFLCDRLRRKKKKKRLAVGAVENPGQKECGKR
ncbi:uncharacterized protein LOC130772501 isoform X2 [Actinidia eriantha]|uniref:uncharacterized protein LOC130772501 isoform X2 n=1 Tax=Actinidia eriantha TaxID=165200 RepID=UPI00258E61CE|nr:uncharacterized protein LOC130772501 isoform X2 [Actinidia eriantha]